jgi:hypothetical protein
MVQVVFVVVVMMVVVLLVVLAEVSHEFQRRPKMQVYRAGATKDVGTGGVHISHLEAINHITAI